MTNEETLGTHMAEPSDNRSRQRARIHTARQVSGHQKVLSNCVTGTALRLYDATGPHRLTIPRNQWDHVLSEIAPLMQGSG